MADLSCYCELGQCLEKFMGLFELNGIDLKPYSKLAQWMARCEALPGFQESHQALATLSPKIRGQRMLSQSTLKAFSTKV